ncbi:MAG: DoxX family protein [Candidatus Liptonbacteria bacterium]|nr:DoxX family protein [Candidatus Liptonbacteria bacterium]
MLTVNLPQSKITRFLFTDVHAAWIWLLLRLYIGYEWLAAGWGKITDANGNWVGANAGTAVKGFLQGALQKTSGPHPDVSAWYAWFINNFGLPNSAMFSYAVAYGEVAVGLGLILGLFTAFAAFFGAVMNFNFLFAGSVSVNPLWLLIEIFLILAWRTAGYWGLDYFAIKNYLRGNKDNT